MTAIAKEEEEEEAPEEETEENTQEEEESSIETLDDSDIPPFIRNRLKNKRR